MLLSARNITSPAAWPTPDRRGANMLLLGACCLAMVAMTLAGGCLSPVKNAIPAYRLPPHLAAPARNGKVAIDFTLLRQQPPPSYCLGPNDVLGIYIQEVLPASKEEPAVVYAPQTSRDQYPASGLVASPALGVPITVQSSGAITLPFVEPIHVAGLTVEQAAARIREAYTVDRKLLQPGRDRIFVSLIKRRVSRVLVLREDTPQQSFQRRDEVLLSRRGSAEVVDLPAYENDVLHALLATGGLPGVDSANEVWVLRSRVDPVQLERYAEQMRGSQQSTSFLSDLIAQRTHTSIPLRICPGELVPFRPEDIVLHDGDIIHLKSRVDEFFYTGGLLPGAQWPLPRDYDLDVIGAISFAHVGVNGPAGSQQAVATNFRNGPGSIVAPTQVLVLRTLPTGEQVRIRVDLRRAMHDKCERIVIQPGDVVMLHYTPCECLSNLALNLFNLNFTVLSSNAFTGSGAGR